MKELLKVENVTVEELGFGHFYMYHATIPCIEITNSDGEVIGYLSAFRNYKFQVSETWDGQWDAGSTPVFGLDTFGNIFQSGNSNLSQESTVKYFISVIANDAILDFTRSGANRLSNGGKIRYITNKDFCYCSYRIDPEFKRFIDACYDRYVTGVDSIPEAPYYDSQLERVVDRITKVG